MSDAAAPGPTAGGTAAEKPVILNPDEQSDDEDNWPAPGETQRFTFEDICDTPLFMTQDEANRKVGSNDTLQAMQSFVYDGKSPMEIASLLKDKANEEMRKAAQIRPGAAKKKPEDRKKGEVTDPRVHWRRAYDLYSEALLQEIDVRGADASFSALLHSNRAQANLCLKNYGKAIEDAVWAIKLDPARPGRPQGAAAGISTGNNPPGETAAGTPPGDSAAEKKPPASVKAYYRGARAAEALGRWAHVVVFCEGGLRVDPGNESLSVLMGRAEGKADEIERRKLQVAESARVERDVSAWFDAAARARGVSLSRSIREVEGLPDGASVVVLDANGDPVDPRSQVEPPRSFGDNNNSNSNSNNNNSNNSNNNNNNNNNNDNDDENGNGKSKNDNGDGRGGKDGGGGWRAGIVPLGDVTLTWPVMFLYPGPQQSDLIAAVHEADTLAEHVATLFPPGAHPLPWDEDASYARGPHVLFYQKRKTEKHGSAGFGRIGRGDTLQDVISKEDCDVPGIPIVHVLVEGSEDLEKFLSE